VKINELHQTRNHLLASASFVIQGSSQKSAAVKDSTEPITTPSAYEADE
jgi:hypothetical protein